MNSKEYKNVTIVGIVTTDKIKPIYNKPHSIVFLLKLILIIPYLKNHIYFQLIPPNFLLSITTFMTYVLFSSKLIFHIMKFYIQFSNYYLLKQSYCSINEKKQKLIYSNNPL
ncbi:Uncharacterised protein [Streptococcus pneumoniae]|nr:Uncharacterised protein [Streptococcus pneumoniae]